MKISVFKGGYINLIPDYEVDFDELCDLLGDVEIGAKNGTYFVRGRCEGKRCDDNIKEISLIVIDGDQSMTNGSSCVPPDPVHKLLKEKNITHAIHSSYSQNIINNIYKWRLIIPCDDIVDENTLKSAVAEVISVLHSNNIMVKNVKENNVISQPWFTPRCSEGFEDDFYFAWHDGKNWKVGKNKILPSAHLDVNDNNKNDVGGCFSWDYAINQFVSGTIHQGVKSICGWLIYTTDWVDSQIKQFILTQIKNLCPDVEKIKRACETKEIDNLIKYCREKQGIVDHVANWKDNLTTGEKLKDKDFPPIKWAVDKIIPEGLTILAGDPKVGKSLLAVDICSSIASGHLAFGNRPCVEGACVYISLEDPERRIKDRIKQQCDIWPDKFKILTGGVPQLGDSFYKLIDEMIMLWPDLRCIVIDTMSFIIPEKKNNIADYEHYYKYLDPLHRWSLNNHVSIILITHTTKAKVNGENPFSAIIGSVAIQGTADAMLMLQKNHTNTTGKDIDRADGFLFIDGREVGSEKFALEFDSEGLKWCFKCEATIKDTTTNMNWWLIHKSLENSITGKRPSEISQDTKINKSTVKTCLGRMLKKSLLQKNNDGFYFINH